MVFVGTDFEKGGFSSAGKNEPKTGIVKAMLPSKVSVALHFNYLQKFFVSL